MSYTLKYHQGSIYATITGNTVERYGFDAWGRRRDPVTLSYDNVTSHFDRGYTGHEHLTDFGLINMNGRMYDPVMSMFLSPDNYIQAPDNSQSFNRYAYCLNNPLKYTDPNGELFILDDIIIGALIGGAICVTMNGICNTTAGNDFFDGAGQAAFVGVLAGATGVGAAALGASMGMVGFVGGGVAGGVSAALNNTNVAEGIGVGALCGMIGGGIGGMIGGGGVGAFVGASAANAAAQIPAVLESGDFDFAQMLFSGILSCGIYYGASYFNWQFRGGDKMGDVDVSFRQFCKMQALFQRSRAQEVEMGGYLMKDGSFQTSPKGHNCQIDLGPRPEGAIAEFHTHWDRPGKTISYNENGDYVTDPYQGRWVSTTSRYHGSMDYTKGIESLVFNRYDGSYFSGQYMLESMPANVGPLNWVHAPYEIIAPPILRYNYGFLFSLKH